MAEAQFMNKSKLNENDRKLCCKKRSVKVKERSTVERIHAFLYIFTSNVTR